MRAIGFTSWLFREASLRTSMRNIAALGCTEVEVAAMPEYLADRTSVHATLDELGMKATAVSLGVPFFFASSSLDLCSPNPEVRNTSLEYVHRSIEFTKALGADFVYACSIVKGATSEHGAALARLEDAVLECADHAKELGVRFGLEPFPTGELPTTNETVRFIDGASTDNLGLLLDTGHAAIAGEALAAAARASAGRISHVHLNNNDGQRDLHWPPQRGKLSRGDFVSLFAELRALGYSGRTSLEISRPDPVIEVLTESRSFVERILVEEARQP